MSTPPAQLPVVFDTVRDSNLEPLKALNRAIFPINYQDKVYRDILACGDVTQLAYHNDVLVGALAARLENSNEGVRLYIITLGVLAPYRSMGVGSALLARSLAAAAGLEAPRCVQAYLHVQTSNTEAIAFYERHGFCVAEMLRGYYPRLDPPDAVLLRKDLPAR